jgi:hypothetical protein
MAAAGANILTCKLSCTVCSAARSGKPMFFNVARTDPVRQMLPSGKSRRQRKRPEATAPSVRPRNGGFATWSAHCSLNRLHRAGRPKPR